MPRGTDVPARRWQPRPEPQRAARQTAADETRRSAKRGASRGKKRTGIYNMLIAVCALVLLLCALMVYLETRDWRGGESAYANTAARAVTLRGTDAAAPSAPSAPATPAPAQTGHGVQPQAMKASELPPIAVDFSLLEAADGGVAGWLYGEDTILNYPVAAGTDNSYYLNHLLDGTRNACGTLFIDSANAPDFSDRNTVIHGHHMKNGSMFGWLESYREQAFFDAHAQLYLLTPNGEYRLDLIAGYTTRSEGDGYEKWFADDGAFLAFVNEARARSDFISDVAVEPDDRLVTLSTCAYVFEHARYVIHARLTPLQ